MYVCARRPTAPSLRNNPVSLVNSQFTRFLITSFYTTNTHRARIRYTHIIIIEQHNCFADVSIYAYAIHMVIVDQLGRSRASIRLIPCNNGILSRMNSFGFVARARARTILVDSRCTTIVYANSIVSSKTTPRFALTCKSALLLAAHCIKYIYIRFPRDFTINVIVVSSVSPVKIRFLIAHNRRVFRFVSLAQRRRIEFNKTN